MKKVFRILLIVFALLTFIALTGLFFSLECKNADIPHMVSMREALWYSVSAFLSINYCDIIVLSFWGKLIGLAFILFGICFLGFIIGGLTNMIAKKYEKRKLGYMGTRFSKHIIILGWDAFSEEVAVQLIKADRKVAVLTDKKDDIDTIYQHYGTKQVFVCFSDENKPGTLDLVNAHESAAIFLNRGSDTDKLISILNIKQSYPQAKLIVLLDNTGLKATFISAGVTYVMSKDEIASRLLASYIFEPAVADYTSDLIASAGHDNGLEYDIQQYRVCKANPYLNQNYGILFRDLKEKHNIVAIGMNKSADNGSRLIKLPSDDEPIGLNDDIIVIVNGKTEGILQKLFKICEGI